MTGRILIVALLSTLLAACGEPKSATSTNALVESEPDFAPGFFESDLDTTAEDIEGGETNRELPAPEEVEEVLNREGVSPFLSFAQTTWNECSGNLTGNYTTYACAKSRQISVILNSFLQQRLMSCVDAGMRAQTGPGSARTVHITHAGIMGDPRHSPLSLHSFNRAIDVKVIKVVTDAGVSRQYTYSKTGNRTFYTELRKCWGRVVNQYNGCPLYSGNVMLTGSIGWENRSHGQHMHLSVPYCLNGRYGSGAWQR